MSRLGIGALIAALAGNEDSAKAFSDAIGKQIRSIELKDAELHLTFKGGTGLIIADEGQSCCESRYMRTDDDLADYVGAKLRGGVIKDGPEVPTEYDAHETQFLEIETSKGSFTITSHVEHNGYYGGFAIRARAA